MVKISAQSQSPLQSLSVHFNIWSLLGLTTFVPSLTAVSVAPMHGTVAIVSGDPEEVGRG